MLVVVIVMAGVALFVTVHLWAAAAINRSNDDLVRQSGGNTEGRSE